MTYSGVRISGDGLEYMDDHNLNSSLQRSVIFSIYITKSYVGSRGVGMWSEVLYLGVL